MAENAGLHCIGVKLVKGSSLDRILYKSRRTSPSNKGEFENCTVKAEKLCGYPEKTARI
jgi:hypothetical protein